MNIEHRLTILEQQIRTWRAIPMCLAVLIVILAVYTLGPLLPISSASALCRQ